MLLIKLLCACDSPGRSCSSADSDSVGLGWGLGLCMSDKLPWTSASAGAHGSWDQDELLLCFQISSPSLKLSWNLAWRWAHQWYLAWSQTSCDFFFLCSKYICQHLVQEKQIFIFEHLLCMPGSPQVSGDKSRPGAKVFSGMCLRECTSPSRWLWQVISPRDFSFTLVLLEWKPFQTFCIHCSFSNALLPLLVPFARQMHRELPD